MPAIHSSCQVERTSPTPRLDLTSGQHSTTHVCELSVENVESASKRQLLKEESRDRRVPMFATISICDKDFDTKAFGVATRHVHVVVEPPSFGHICSRAEPEEYDARDMGRYQSSRTLWTDARTSMLLHLSVSRFCLFFRQELDSPLVRHHRHMAWCNVWRDKASFGDL